MLVYAEFGGHARRAVSKPVVCLPIAKTCHDGVSETGRCWRIARCQVTVDSRTEPLGDPSNIECRHRKSPVSRLQADKAEGFRPHAWQHEEIGRSHSSIDVIAIEPTDKFDV